MKEEVDLKITYIKTTLNFNSFTVILKFQILRRIEFHNNGKSGFNIASFDIFRLIYISA